jgi:hypothetical protein
MLAETTLTVEKLTCHVHMAESRSDPGATRDVLEQIARQELAIALRELDLPLEGSEETVYRLRSLRMELWLETGQESRHMTAARWGRAIAAAVVRDVQRGDPNRVMRFDSSRDFLLHFLRDLVDGRAWGLWYYQEFSLLRVLPDERAALELLVQRPDWIATLLAALLESGHAGRLLARWQAADLARLWAVLGYDFALPSEAELVDGLQRQASAWDAALLSGGTDVDARARDTMLLWLSSSIQDARTFSLARAVVDLAALLRRVPETGGVLLMESELDPLLTRRILESDVRGVLDWLLPLNADQEGRTRLARIAEAAARGTAGNHQEGSFSSPVGAIALLALGLADLGLWETWTVYMPESEARRCLYVLALKALGSRRAPLHLSDPALAALAGLEAPPAADARLPVEEDTGPPPWLQELPRLAARHTPLHAWRLSAATDSDVDILRDETANQWLSVRHTSGEPLSGWNIGGPAPHPPSAASQARFDAEAEHLLGGRLAYPWLTPSLDTALAAAASLALRRLAARLPNFQSSSPAYLASQFLAQPARWSPGWRVVLDGGPLRVVLSLAVLPERLSVPWLPQPLSFALREPGTPL